MAMQSRYITKLIKWGGLGTLAIAVWLPATFSQAGEITQKGRDVFVCTDEKYIEVGDVPDHLVGVYKCEGISSTEGGEAGIIEFQGTGDYIAGKGPEQGYYTITYDDGSAVHGKFEDILVPDEGGKSSTCKGTYQITSGTDRFAGIKGSGSYTCKSYSGKGYYDWTETYTVP
jgi:hypothetical protein